MKDWYEERKEGATHNQRKVEHTQKHKTKAKTWTSNNIHNGRKDRSAGMLHAALRYATLRYGNEKSKTITVPTKVTKRCSRENMPSPARPHT